MKTILISLISDQTIPNLLAIDNFQPDELLFLTTEAMEKKQKFKAIMETLLRTPRFSFSPAAGWKSTVTIK